MSYQGEQAKQEVLERIAAALEHGNDILKGMLEIMAAEAIRNMDGGQVIKTVVHEVQAPKAFIQSSDGRNVAGVMSQEDR